MTWIKVDVTTPDKPEIIQIARRCGVGLNEAFGAWFRLWAWFDASTADGRVPYLQREDCDLKAGLDGIGKALEEVGWIEFSAAGAIIIDWERHNGKSAKSRALTARRVADHRSM